LNSVVFPIEDRTKFQKIIDSRGIVLNEPIALAHLGLARTYMLQGNTTKARAAYEDFLALWKDADPDVPILSEAKAEYAKLQRSCASSRFQYTAGVKHDESQRDLFDASGSC
jgi:Tfp pilus assembly protein PilF